MDDQITNFFSDKEKESWKKFSEQRKKDLMSPEFPYLHRSSYDQMAMFQFLQYKWSLSSQNENPFNMNDGLEYSLRVHKFGPDIRQITNFYSSSYYLNKINQQQSSQSSQSSQPSQSSQSSAVMKSTTRPSFFGKGSTFGSACYKKYENVFIPNCPKRSDSKFNSPFSYYTDRRIKVIEKEKPDIKKSLLLPEIVREWESMNDSKKGHIRDIWKNYIAIQHQLYQQEKEEKNYQFSLKTKIGNESENSTESNNENTNINHQESNDAQNKTHLLNELKKNQEDLDKAIDEALK